MCVCVWNLSATLPLLFLQQDTVWYFHEFCFIKIFCKHWHKLGKKNLNNYQRQLSQIKIELKNDLNFLKICLQISLLFFSSRHSGIFSRILLHQNILQKLTLRLSWNQWKILVKICPEFFLFWKTQWDIFKYLVSSSKTFFFQFYKFICTGPIS